MSLASQQLNDVVGRLNSSVRPGILAGHYCINPDLDELSSGGESEQSSMRFGAALYRRRIEDGQEAELVVWVNDIGITPEERIALKANYKLPEAYQEILEEAQVSASVVRILFEGTMRNKASTLLRKIAAREPDRFDLVDASDPNLVRCTEKVTCEIAGPRPKFAHSIPGPHGKPLVLKEGPNPKCNLILGTLYQSVIHQFKCDTIVNVFNSIYVNRIELGVHVSRNVFDSTAPFVNVFCDAEAFRIGSAA